ncbi:MAG: hypothetical protein K0U24_01530 [Gammaproteobacteria bacterium]|nr:hypothetical protein [Gammaproteobacteria bacterium]MCH9715714.1 hypothetical protein [Gammaproteobacteria bacterium]MCH9762909.1 hypothetical protein [Gammaproteobacteria bacterium]
MLRINSAPPHLSLWDEPDVDVPGQYPGVARKAVYDAVCQFLDNAGILVEQKVERLTRFIEEEAAVALQYTHLARSGILDAANIRLRSLVPADGAQNAPMMPQSLNF